MYRVLANMQRTSNCSQLEASVPSGFISKVPRLLGIQYTLFQLRSDDNATPSKGCSRNEQQKKSKESFKITLKGQNNSLSVISLEEARKLAKRRDLHLVQMQELDFKTQRPLYKLVTAAETLSKELEELKPCTKHKSAQSRPEKALTIGSRISDNDLASRLRSISKWLVKNHDVHILIQGASGDLSTCEKIVKSIELSIKEPQVLGKIVQKRMKGYVIKFMIVPVKATTTAKTDDIST